MISMIRLSLSLSLSRFLSSLPAVVALVGFLGGATPAIAADVPYVPGTGWKGFRFDDVVFGGSGMGRNVDGEFTFKVYAGQNAMLTVADSGWNCEKFLIYNHGNYTNWQTSDPGPPSFVGDYYRTDYDYTSTEIWSRKTWALTPGTYKLSFGLGTTSYDKPDTVTGGTYFGAFKVEITETPDADGDRIADQFETGTGIYVSPVNTGSKPDSNDSDGDLLSDWDEVFKRLTDPNKADTDGDGFSDSAEIQAGKSPTNAASNPDAAMEMRTAVEVTLYTKLGTNYQVEWSDDLTTWTTLPEIIPGDGNPVTKLYSTRDFPKRYFRAVKLAAE